MVFHSVLEGAPSKLGQITVEERTYLGANAFVLPGITIGHDAIIGARAVITKNVNADTVMVGNPAKEIGKTSQRTSKLLTEDKKKIVKNILLDFIDVHHEKISHIKLWDNSEMTFFYQNQTIAFIPCSDTFTVVDKKKKNPDILISFNIPEKVRAECDKNAIPWFDLDSGTKSSIMNTYSRSLERFFKNYGIVIA